MTKKWYKQQVTRLTNLKNRTSADDLKTRLELDSKIRYLNKLVDSDMKDFDGDLVITDPCYTDGDDRDRDYSDVPMYRSTLYGDWGCTTFDTDTHEPIGHFCADAGLVCIDTLENIHKRDPEFENRYSDWYRTIIPNFKGKAGFKVVKQGKDDYEVRVVGEGINKITGERISFITSQTSL